MRHAPLKDIRATLDHMVDARSLARTDRYADATPELVDQVLTEAGRLCQDVLAPLNRAGDLDGARLENGVVRTTPGFAEAYRAFAEGGWIGVSAEPEQGGMGLPLYVNAAVNEMASGACLALSLCPLLSQGAIDALEHHGTPEQKALYLPKLVSGEWNGTMNLTEPQAGSDVGALRAKAEPNGDGSYAITGGKIWISWGDSDVVSNVVHLVLARLPGAPAGSKGISLFLVPKFLPDADGAPGRRNNLQVVSLDHKMGLHGSPPCVMAYEGATGWLVGEENKGLACMFTMMNNARLGVGLEGVGVAEAATQKALAWAQERRQGRTPIADGAGTIADHADVRRMLLTMKTQTQAARAIAYDCATHLDRARAAASPEARKAAADMGAFLTPIAKAFGTDTGIEIATLGVQVHGGMGYIEETGAAQYLRDVRVTAIYEGTNGIQAMDLVGRKMQDGGETAFTYLDRCAATADALEARDEGRFSEIAGPLRAAVERARAVTRHMTTAEMNDRFAGAVAYLRQLALTGGGMYLGRAALSGDPARIDLARFYAAHLLPQAHAAADAATRPADLLYRLTSDDLAA